ncbi:hypothetical protein FOMPIDRAFT_88136, partial [Fomitopsis schrenkii]
MDTGTTHNVSASLAMGGVFVALTATFILFGMNLGQFNSYRVMFPNDRKRVKVMVRSVFVLDVAHTCFCVALIYMYLVRWHGNEARMSYIHWTTAVSAAFQNATLSVVQGASVYKLWLLSERSKIVAVAALLTILRTAFGYASDTLMPMKNVWSNYRDDRIARTIILVSLSCSFADDAFITASLAYYLHRKRTGMRGTEYIIRIVTLYAINFGALTMLTSLSALLSFLLYENSILFGGLVELSTK